MQFIREIKSTVNAPDPVQKDSRELIWVFRAPARELFQKRSGLGCAPQNCVSRGQGQDTHRGLRCNAFKRRTVGFKSRDELGVSHGLIDVGTEEGQYVSVSYGKVTTAAMYADCYFRASWIVVSKIREKTKG